MPSSRCLVLSALIAVLATVLHAAEPREFSGEIDGALYKILAPAGDWNGSLWIEAHGLRMEDTPLLADLSPAEPFNAEMLERGWAIATTSFRRNGLVIDDAITDVENLRRAAEAMLGKARIVVVEGSSMGGAVVTLLAEREDSGLTGVVAAGAALQVVDPQYTQLRFTHRPRIPIVFLTNQSELEAPEAYVVAAREQPAEVAVEPVLWKVLRDGHVNVNAPERLAALDAIVAWATAGESPGDRADATVRIEAPSTITIEADGSMRVTVTDLARAYGNLYTNLRPADMVNGAIKRGDYFELIAPGGTFRVLYGTTYNDVPVGDWVAFPIAQGTMMISRNFANGAGTAKLAIGDTFAVKKSQATGDSMSLFNPAALQDFAARYTAAWCSRDAAGVAGFFSPGGSLTINNGEPSVGRTAITAVAQGFMDAFPDMVVSMDSVHESAGRVIYSWTLTGTNTGPGGTGKRVRISGSESWRLSGDALISESLGSFDEKEYKRQLEQGVE